MIKLTKLTVTLLLLSLLVIGCLSRNVEKAKDSERKQLFDFDWKFSLEDSSKNSLATIDDSQWRKLDLPHDWSIEGKSEKDNVSGGAGGFFPMGVGWYRKTFSVPSNWEKQKISIYFEGVYMNAEVFVNGKSVGMHPYGYTSFKYDLNPYLKFGENNSIAVKVDNSQQQNCRWYSGSGIYRHVWLMVKDPIHIKHWGVAITTPEVNKADATVQLKTIIKNETDAPQSIALSANIINKKGSDVANAETNIELEANSQKEIVQSIEVRNPILWSPENPNLYQAKLMVKQDAKAVDAVTRSFGIRTIAFSAEDGFLLNGKNVILNGG